MLDFNSLQLSLKDYVSPALSTGGQTLIAMIFVFVHRVDNVVLTAGTKTPDPRREAALCRCEYKV